MPKFRKSSSELEAELREQIEDLRSTAERFDAGVDREAKRLAAIVYILMHEGTGRTRSLLGMLGLRGKIPLLSSLVLPPTRGEIIAASAAPLLLMHVTDKGAKYVAPLGSHPLSHQFKWLPAHKWWEERIFHPISGISLTRKNMVFAMRTQDGGGHVDDHLTDKDYHFFKNAGGPTERSMPAGSVLFSSSAAAEASGLPPVLGGDRATIRQIAWELNASLQKAGY